jgi:hypothetical protein
VGGSASVAVNAGPGGILTLSCVDNTQNRECYVATTTSCFTIAANKPLMAEVQLQYAEASTNKAGVIFGFMSAVGAGALADTTLVPKSSFTGAVIFKSLNTVAWQTCASVGAVQTTTAVDAGLVPGGTNYQRLAVEIMPVSATLAEVSYWIDSGGGLTANSGGTLLQARDNTTRHNLIKDTITYTGALNMQLFVGVKCGTTAAETLNVDYLAASALR